MAYVSSPGSTLRALPLSARLVLTVFLFSVGLGYLSALMQLYYQHADKSKGQLIPGRDETIRIFHDQTHNLPPDKLPKGRIEELLTADPDQKLITKAQMRTAFTDDSDDWQDEIVNRSLKKKVPVDQAILMLREEREGERLAVLAWIHAERPKSAYDQDSFTLPADWKKEQPITAKYVLDGGKAVKFKSIVTDRCVRCHKRGGEATNVPFESFSQIQTFVPLHTQQPRMPLKNLAQSTHVHLLGFSMLYGLTGLILAFSSYSRLLRYLLCPLPLVAQVLDIGCWWLAREATPYGLFFAAAIPITGGIVALGLLAHIFLSVFDLFDGPGKIVLVVVLASAGAGGFLYVKPIVETEIKRAQQEAADMANRNKDESSKTDDKTGMSDVNVP